jgi:hypothetical protein
MAHSDNIGNPLTAGQRVFERYYLKRTLGQGGMSSVWLAQDRVKERLVALKFLPTHLATDEKEIERLKIEAARSPHLAHPNIVQLYEFHHGNHGVAVAMEYVEGWSLWAMRVDKPGHRFPISEIEPWIRELCRALDHIHTVGIVHRDVKPDNLILNARSQLKHADFGLSRAINSDLPDVGYHGVVGTDFYMSPQQWTGDPPAVADDVYSVGTTIYELLTGKPPFHDGDIFKQLFETIPPAVNERLIEFGVRRPGIPEAWEETVAACLDKDATRRPPSARDVAAMLGL